MKHIVSFLLIASALTSSVFACNQSIPPGAGCITGTAYGPGKKGPQAVLCSDWDTFCSAPLQTIYNFSKNTNQFEFLMPGENFYRVGMQSGGQSFFYWTTGNNTTLYYVGSGSAQYYSAQSYCTQFGWQYGGSSYCNQ